MNQIKNPLDYSSKAAVEVLGSVSVAKLAKLYQRKLGIDIFAYSDLADYDEIAFCRCSDSDLRFFSPPTPGNPSFYAELEKHDWYYTEAKPEFGFARQFLEKQAAKVLEIGCGEGHWGESLQSGDQEFDYVGIESNPVAREKARNRQLNVVDGTLADHVQEYPDYYDAVAAFQVLEHVDNVQEFVQLCLACLKPGGWLIYSVPSYDTFVSLAPNNFMNMPPHHLSWWSDKALTYLAQRFNLNLVTLHHETLSPQHRHWYSYTLIFNQLSSWLRRPRKLIYSGPGYTTLSQLANWLACVLEPCFSEARLMPRGHSVTVIYRKPVL